MRIPRDRDLELWRGLATSSLAGLIFWLVVIIVWELK